MSRTYKAVVRGEPGPTQVRVLPVPPKFWVPKEGQRLLIELPNERLMALVAKVLNPDVVICELTDVPLLYGKTHQYQKGAFVPCERIAESHETVWRAFQPRAMPQPAPEPDEPQKPRSRRKGKNAARARK